MTDLSTSNLKRLLAEATPGPWTVEFEEVPDFTLINGEAVEVDAVHAFLVGATRYPLNFRYKHDAAKIAALAPELLAEVIRMREALRDLSEVWEAVSIGPFRTPAEQQLAAAVVYHIDQILGDHDG